MMQRISVQWPIVGSWPASDQILIELHRWIAQRCLSTLLIDVHNYSHVHLGPGVLLVAHEGHYSFAPGTFTYHNKRTLEGDLNARIAETRRRGEEALQLWLAAWPGLAPGKPRLRGDDRTPGAAIGVDWQDVP
jgi:hypothetical protein